MSRGIAFTLIAAIGAALSARGAEAPAPTTDAVLARPITPLVPGAPPAQPPLANPVADDPAAPARGMQDFVQFNCVGCHAPNGAGGMGPSLSDNIWLYGSKPSEIFATIYEGRPKGMPAWGRTLPASTIWDLVSYVQSIAEKPGPHFGQTISKSPPSPPKQQVPAEFLTTAQPWEHLQPFGNGQKPEGP